MKQRFIIIMMGFTASGKSTISQKLSEKLGTDIFHSAVTRKKLGLADFSKKEAKEEFFDLTKDGRKDMDMKVYSENCKLATESLKSGKDVIIDAGHFFIWQRGMIYKSVADINPEVIILRVFCSEEETIKRLKRRLEEFNNSLFNETPSMNAYESSKIVTEYPDDTDVLENGKKPTIIEFNSEKNETKLIQGNNKSDVINKVLNAIKMISL